MIVVLEHLTQNQLIMVVVTLQVYKPTLVVLIIQCGVQALLTPFLTRDPQINIQPCICGMQALLTCRTYFLMNHDEMDEKQCSLLQS